MAVANLERQGYEVYLPRVVQILRRAGRELERTGPLFPRYLFLRLFEGRQALGPVASTLGVAAIVRFGSQYTVVPDKVVLDLRARAEPDTGLHRLACEPRLLPGTEVTVSSGPFDGLEGVFEREAGADRVVVLLKLLGHNAQVSVSIDSIEVRRAV